MIVFTTYSSNDLPAIDTQTQMYELNVLYFKNIRHTTYLQSAFKSIHFHERFSGSRCYVELFLHANSPTP